jgi:hypothetical protein
MPQANDNLWTAFDASEWSGIKYRQLLRLFHAGEAPCIRIGDPQIQNMGRGRKKRRRAVGRFLVPKKAFITWFENLTPRNSNRRRAA